jgi:ribosomal protein S18 acetylase RimI-like enzyme
MPIDATRNGARAAVRKGRVEETGQLARVLANAFEDDPVSTFVLPDESTRRRRLEELYRLLFVPDALSDDECYTTTDHGCVALWKPADKPRPSLLETFRLAPKIARVLGRQTPRALRVLNYMEAQPPQEPHAHLVLLGTDPEHQGQGRGSLMLRETLARLDRERVPAYLEASTVRSRALYLRHGFVVLNEIHLPGGGPPLWRMWRDPQGPQ